MAGPLIHSGLLSTGGIVGIILGCFAVAGLYATYAILKARKKKAAKEAALLSAKGVGPE
jgi:hypothetical protein